MTTEIPGGSRPRLRGLLVASVLALVFWATWVFNPRNFASPTVFALVAAGQLLDFLVVVGFWHAIWPRRAPVAPFAPVRGRASVLVLTHDQPIHVVEQTLQAAVAVQRRHRVFLADPSERPDLRWLAGWYGVKRLSPGMEELEEVAGARFLAVIEAGQVPRPDFLERLLPYFADRRLALVQAGYSLRNRLGVRDAVLRRGDSLGEAWCLGTNYVLRRSALHSVGGFGPGTTSVMGVVRLARALRADQWRTRYVGELLTASVRRAGSGSRMADGWRRSLAQLAVALRPGSRHRPDSLSARLFASWAVVRYPALLGLPVSALALAVYATLGPLSLGWYLSLAVHLVPYLVLRVAVRTTVGARRPAIEPPVRQPAWVTQLPDLEPDLEPEPELEAEPVAEPEAATVGEPDAAEAEPSQAEPELEPAAAASLAAEDEPEAQELFELVPEIKPEMHLGWKALSSPQPGDEELPPAVMPRRRSSARPRLGLSAAAAAWIVTAGIIGAAALAVIQTNPPQRPISVPKVSAPPYSYYAPVSPAAGPRAAP